MAKEHQEKVRPASLVREFHEQSEPGERFFPGLPPNELIRRMECGGRPFPWGKWAFRLLGVYSCVGS